MRDREAHKQLGMGSVNWNPAVTPNPHETRWTTGSNQHHLSLPRGMTEPTDGKALEADVIGLTDEYWRACKEVFTMGSRQDLSGVTGRGNKKDEKMKSQTGGGGARATAWIRANPSCLPPLENTCAESDGSSKQLFLRSDCGKLHP